MSEKFIFTPDERKKLRKLYQKEEIEDLKDPNFFKYNFGNSFPTTQAEFGAKIPVKKGKVRTFVDETFRSVGGGVQDLLEEYSTKVYTGLKAVEKKFDPSVGKSREELYEFVDSNTPISWNDDIAKIYNAATREEYIDNRVAGLIGRQKRFSGELGKDYTEKLDRVAYRNDLQKYQDFTGALSAIIPPPKDYRFLDEYKESDYGKYYEIAENETIVGSLARGITRFVTQAVLQRRIVGKIPGVNKIKAPAVLSKKLPKTSKTLSWLGTQGVSGLGAGFIAFNPEEANLTDLVLSVPEDKRKPLFEPVFWAAERLQENPDDPLWKKYVKQLSSDAAANILFGGAFKGVAEPFKLLFKGKKTLPDVEKRVLDLEKTDSKGVVVRDLDDPETLDTAKLLEDNPKYDSARIEELDNHNINTKKIATVEGLEEEIVRIADLDATGKLFPESRLGPTRKETKAGAEKIRELDPEGTATTDLIRKKYVTPKLVYSARMLMVKQFENAQLAAKDFYEAGTKATEEQRAEMLRQIARFSFVLETVTGATANAGRVLDTFNMKVYGSKQMKASALRELNDSISQEISKGGDLMELAGRLKDADGLDESIAQGLKESFASRSLKKATTIMYASMLGDPSTGTINFLGSLGAQVWETFAVRPTAWAIGYSKKLSGKDDPDRVLLSQVFARPIGIAHSILQNIQDPTKLNALRTGYEAFKRLDLPENVQQTSYEYRSIAGQTGFGKDQSLASQTEEAFRRRQARQEAGEKGVMPTVEAYGQTVSAIGGKAGQIVFTAPMRILIGTDAAMKAIAANARIHEEAFAAASRKFGGLTMKNRKEYYKFTQDFIKNPPARVYDVALGEAAFNTFTKKNAIARRLTFTPGTPMHGLTRPFIPFVQTVTNLWEYGLLNSPFAKGMTNYREDILKGGAEADKAAARMYLGTGLASIGFMGATGMFGDDVEITGTGLSIDYPFLQTREAGGWHEFSYMKTNEDGTKTAWEYNRLDPFAMPLVMGADLADMMNMYVNMADQGKEGASTYLLEFAKLFTLSMWRNTAERNPAVTGLEELARSMQAMRGIESGSGIRPLVNRYIQSVTPALGRREIYMNDPYTLDTYAISDTAKMMLHAWAAVPDAVTRAISYTATGGQETVHTNFREWSAEKLNIKPKSWSDVEGEEWDEESIAILEGDRPDIIPYKFDMITGKVDVNETYRDSPLWGINGQIPRIMAKHTVYDDAVAKALAEMGWSRRRLNHREIKLGGLAHTITKGEYFSYQNVISARFRMGVEQFIQTDTYRDLRARGQMKELNNTYITKIWTEALETGKNHLISLRDNSTRRAIKNRATGEFEDNFWGYDKRYQVK
jgi:hypothetical protein